MNQKQIEHVQQSFELVKPITEAASNLFYDRLFELDPSLRPYFKEDMSEQKMKLMSTLAFVVTGLNEPETIMPAVQALGIRHVGYGTQPEHYQTVGAALIWALAQGLGDRFTSEVEEAWTAAYTMLAEAMIDAAALDSEGSG
ncbi:MAG: globin family protein [Ardenticatenaceae bacterium]|nr:globin family protein [Ardenticatenaceae bacterium]